MGVDEPSSALLQGQGQERNCHLTWIKGLIPGSIADDRHRLILHEMMLDVAKVQATTNLGQGRFTVTIDPQNRRQKVVGGWMCNRTERHGKTPPVTVGVAHHDLGTRGAEVQTN